jgi:ParB family chromosome partitioning protein
MESVKETSMAEEARSRLGRGLAALIGDVSEETPTGERPRPQRRVPIEFVHPNPRNPRRDYSDTELEELAASIRERGIIQPIVVRPVRGAHDAYEIIAGERRWRAAQRAAVHEVPIVVLDVSDGEALELAIIENVQRADLNPIEEANGYQALIEQYEHSQEGVAKIVGKSRAHVTNTLRLLKLPPEVQDFVRSGEISAGHARVLIGQPNAAQLALEIVNRDLSVRDVEDWARQSAARGTEREHGQHFAKPKVPRASKKDADTLALEKRLSDALGLIVTIDHKQNERGQVTIKYKTLDQLDDIVRRLEQGD